MRIMVRSAEDDFAALRTANAMESAGAAVFAITPNGTATHFGAREAHIRFQVWAKVNALEDIAAVDKAIEAEFEKS